LPKPFVELIITAVLVIDERIVTPAAIVYLVVKLRLTPPTSSSANAEKEESVDTVDDVKQRLREEEAKDYAFLTSKAESEEGFGDDAAGWAHAPLWPANRKPSWWLVLGFPTRARQGTTEATNSSSRLRRRLLSSRGRFTSSATLLLARRLSTTLLYVIAFVCPGNHSDCTFKLTIDDPAALTTEERGNEDEISDPEEDSLAGQMAALRGGSVKRVAADGESDEDESGTDDDEESGSGSSSDSDSD
jgi:translocation protein SEC63